MSVVVNVKQDVSGRKAAMTRSLNESPIITRAAGHTDDADELSPEDMAWCCSRMLFCYNNRLMLKGTTESTRRGAKSTAGDVECGM